MKILYIWLSIAVAVLASVLAGGVTASPAAAQNSCGLDSQIPESECSALLDLYTQTNGPNWTESDGWLSSPDPCDWLGVACTDNHVTRLALEHNGMTGQIPPSIGQLQMLEFLSLHVNHLNGPIPSEIGELQLLRYLEFSNNDLSGSIPPEIGNLPLLDHLDLSANELSGEIPPGLTNLPIPVGTDFETNPTELPGFPNRLFLYQFEFVGNGCFTADVPTTAWLVARDPRWNFGCDVTGPETTPLSPTAAETVTTGPSVQISGTASDAPGVTNGVNQVLLALYDKDTFFTWDGSAFTSPYTRVPAVLTPSVGTDVSWSYTFAGPGVGEYAFGAQSFDEAGNRDASITWRHFDVRDPAGDLIAPETVPVTPGVNEVVTDPTVTLSGSATDNVGVSEVLLAVYDKDTFFTWDGSAFTSPYTRVPAVLTPSVGTDVSWSYTFAGPGVGEYAFGAQSFDEAGNRDASITWRHFDVRDPAGDLIAPETVPVTPGVNEVVTDPTVTLSGSATDNVGVSEVLLAVYDKDTFFTWDGSAFTSPYTRVPAVLTPSVGTDVSWSYTFAGPGVGEYAFGAQSFDEAGNRDASITWRHFDVRDPAGDLIAPETVPVTPGVNEVVTDPTVTLSGSATDNVGVSEVLLAVYDKDTFFTWDGSAFTSPYTRVPAVLTPSVGTDVSWSYTFAGPGVGEYAFGAQSFDEAGNRDASITWRHFDVE